MYRAPAPVHAAGMPLSPSLVARLFLVDTGAMGGRAAFALPAGTVTFLLTDVEGSTRLWRDRRDEMSTAMVRHGQILDETIAAVGGVRPVEQGEGDSVVAAFARAVDAVDAAVQAQRRLVAELPWLKVRMALHTGDAVLQDDGNYVGLSIIRCARLRACGHGGQIVASEATAALVADAGVELIDLGSVRLRDLTRAERVFQVVHPDILDQFPPLRSLDTAPHNLPTTLTSLIGRDADLATVAGLLAEHRLVTVVGSGGCGKTRLAQHVAADMIDHHPAGTWWVELAPLTEEAQIAEAVATSLGLGAVIGADVTARVVRHLAVAGRTLIVLDNAEHLLDGVSRTAERLLSSCPAVRILVTSREALAISGETIWRVPSLAAPRRDEHIVPDQLNTFDAVRLFLERARTARPNLVVDDETAPFIAAICARLDGIPLALELAAARVRSMTLQRLAVGLDDAFRLLTGGARTALPRQQTLLASIAWSVDLLDDVDQAVLRRLAAFQGPFTLDGAEAVTTDDDLVAPVDVLDALARLVDKSLVEFDAASDRYRLLATVRQFGLDRLRERDELAVTRTRHARWFASVCVEIGRGERGLDPTAMASDLLDILAAQEWAYDADSPSAFRMIAGLGWVRTQFGHFDQLRRQAEWLLAEDRDGHPELWAHAVVAQSVAAVWLQRFDLLDLLDDAVEALPDDAHRARRLAHYLGAWAAAVQRADVEQICQLAQEADADADDLAVQSYVAGASLPLVWLGQFERARELFACLHRALDRHHQRLGAVTGLLAYAIEIELAIWEARFDDARVLIGSDVSLDVPDLPTTAAAVAILAAATDDRPLLERAEAWLEHREIHPGVAAAAVMLRHIRAVLDGRLTDAADLADEAWQLLEAVRGVRSWCLIDAVVSGLAVGRIERARELVEAYAADVDTFGRQPFPVATLLRCRSLLALEVERDDEALDAAHELVELAHATGLALHTIDALETIAELLHRRDAAVPAARLLGAAAAGRDTIGYRRRHTPHPDQLEALVGQLAAEHPDAFAEGRSLSMGDAIEYARRARGQRRRPNHGWDSLTPTEQRVTSLVARGHTNDQVAERLLMSPTTVKTHLTHVFTKLGVTNRTELAAAYADRT